MPGGVVLPILMNPIKDKKICFSDLGTFFFWWHVSNIVIHIVSPYLVKNLPVLQKLCLKATSMSELASRVTWWIISKEKKTNNHTLLLASRYVVGAKHFTYLVVVEYPILYKFGIDLKGTDFSRSSLLY